MGKISLLVVGRQENFKKINSLIKDIETNGAMQGIGKPEALKGNLLGWYSRRIDEKNRLIYRILEDDSIEISQCRSHYGDKKNPCDKFS